jgi:hypothetical protein
MQNTLKAAHWFPELMSKEDSIKSHTPGHTEAFCPESPLVSQRLFEVAMGESMIVTPHRCLTHALELAGKRAAGVDDYFPAGLAQRM